MVSNGIHPSTLPSSTRNLLSFKKEPFTDLDGNECSTTKTEAVGTRVDTARMAQLPRVRGAQRLPQPQ